MDALLLQRLPGLSGASDSLIETSTAQGAGQIAETPGCATSLFSKVQVVSQTIDAKSGIFSRTRILLLFFSHRKFTRCFCFFIETSNQVGDEYSFVCQIGHQR